MAEWDMLTLGTTNTFSTDNQVPLLGSSTNGTLATVNPISPQLQQMQMDYLNSSKNYMDWKMGQEKDFANSWQNKYLKPATKIVSGLGSLANIYLGFKQYGIAKKQLSMAQEQWDTTKKEMSRIQSVREKITKHYMES